MDVENKKYLRDRKDPKDIAGLINAGRYSYPYLPDGVYADLRTASNLRFRMQTELTIKKMPETTRTAPTASTSMLGSLIETMGRF